MKHSILFFMAVAVLAAMSCTKDPDSKPLPEKELVTMSFDATLSTPTKTELGESNGAGGYKVLWSKDDAIAVIPSVSSATTGSTQPVQFTTDILSATSSATFTGEIADAADYDAFYAVYPYSSASSWSEYYDNIVVNLSAGQVSNEIASGIAVATAVDGNLNFEYVTGFVKFTIPDVYTNIKEIRFRGKNAAPLAGQYYVYRDGVTANKFGSSKLSELTLLPASGDVFTPGTYYFTSFPASLSGFTISFVDTDMKVATKETDKIATIKAGRILNLGEMTGLSFETTLPSVSWDLTRIDYDSATDDEVTWSSENITMTLSKGTSSSKANNYLGGSDASYLHTRIYKGHVLSFSPVDGYEISKIVCESTDNVYAKSLKDDNIWSNSASSIEGKILTILPLGLSRDVSVTVGVATRLVSVKVYYVPDGNYVEPTLESIVVMSNTKDSFAIDEPFSFDGKIVANYTDGYTLDVTDKVEFSGFNSSTSGEKVITVSYNGKSTTYVITVSAGTEYTKYMGELVEGDYIFVYNSAAMKNVVSSSRMSYVEVDIDENKILCSDDSIVWKLVKCGEYWTIYNESVDKYLASTGAANKAQLLSSGTDDKSLWKVTKVEGNYDFTNKANEINGVNMTLRRNGTYGFACYGTKTGGALTLYKK